MCFETPYVLKSKPFSFSALHEGEIRHIGSLWMQDTQNTTVLDQGMTIRGQ